ncbi:MAG: tyrosine-type recombinase/integrase [Dermatophilaceae bacterium]
MAPSAGGRRRRWRGTGQSASFVASRASTAATTLPRWRCGWPRSRTRQHDRATAANWRRCSGFDTAVRSTGLDATPHDLRRTFGSLARMAGADLRFIQKAMGHESITMTARIYAHLYDDELDAIAHALDGLHVPPADSGGALTCAHSVLICTVSRCCSPRCSDVRAGQPVVPPAGFEPATPSLGGSSGVAQLGPAAAPTVSTGCLGVGHRLVVRMAYGQNAATAERGQGEPPIRSGALEPAGVVGSRVAVGHRVATRSALDAARRSAESGAQGRRRLVRERAEPSGTGCGQLGIRFAR